MVGVVVEFRYLLKTFTVGRLAHFKLIIIGNRPSKDQFEHFPLLYLEVPILSTAEHLRTPRAQRVVAVVETLGKIGATVAITQGPIRNLEIGLSKRRSEGMAAPNRLILIDERVSLARTETEEESGLAWVLVPLSPS
jgi:hypothetical protein